MKLKIEKTNAQQAYDNADEKGKKLLEDMFPGEFKIVSIFDRCKTWEDVARIKGIDPLRLPFLNSKGDTSSAVNAFFKAITICEVLNEGWKPNWDNSSEYKYYPYFDMRSSAGFSCDSYNRWLSDTSVGSRLCFKNAELAKYAGEQFNEIYKAFFVLPK